MATAQGVWAAYNGDGSGTAVFPSEVVALRHAVSLGMRVVFWPFGQTLEEATAAAERAS